MPIQKKTFSPGGLLTLTLLFLKIEHVYTKVIVICPILILHFFLRNKNTDTKPYTQNNYFSPSGI